MPKSDLKDENASKKTKRIIKKSGKPWWVVKLDKPVPNLKTITQTNPSEPDVVPVMSRSKPTVVNLVDSSLIINPAITVCTVQESSKEMKSKNKNKKYLAAQTNMQGTAQTSLQGTAQTNMQGAAQTNMQGTSQTSMQGVAQTNMQGAAQTNMQSAAQTNMQCTSQTSMQGAPQTNIQGTAQTSMQGTSQTSIQGAAQTNMQGAAQTNMQGTSQTSMQGAAQTNMQGAVQSNMPGTAQTNMQGTSQTSIKSAAPTNMLGAAQTNMQGTSQTSMQGAAQTNMQGAVQTSIQGAAQTNMQGAAQTNMQGTSQTSMQDAAQTIMQGAVQTSIQGAAQTNMKGISHSSMQGAAQTNMQGTVQISMQGAAQTNMQGSAQISMQGAAQTNMQGSAHINMQGAAQTNVQGTSQTSMQGAAQINMQGRSQTSIQAAAQTDMQGTTQTRMQGVAVQTSTPLDAQTSTPPAAQTSTPPADQTSRPPAAQASTSPAAQTSTSPAAQTSTLPAAQTSILPAAQTSTLPAAQTSTTPTAQDVAQPIETAPNIYVLPSNFKMPEPVSTPSQRERNKRMRQNIKMRRQKKKRKKFNKAVKLLAQSLGSKHSAATYRYPKVFADAPIWPSNPMMNTAYPNGILWDQQPPDIDMNPATSPIFVQTENPVDVEQSFLPSDIYSYLGANSVTIDSPIGPMMYPAFPNAILDLQPPDNNMNPATLPILGQTENPVGFQQSYSISDIYPELGTNHVTMDSPIWPNNPMMNTAFPNPTLDQQPPVNLMNPATSPILVQTENPVDVQLPYLPSYINSDLRINPEPPEVYAKSSEHFRAQNESEQKRLSAFQRLSPVSQPKKPKLTINLNLKKDRPVRKVVNETDGDSNKYTSVHLRKAIMKSTDETVMKYLRAWPWRKNIAIERNVTSVMILEQEKIKEAYEKENIYIQISVKRYPSTWTKERVLDAVLDNVKGYSLIPCFTEFTQRECKFLVLRCRSALIVLHKTGFYIHKDGVELAITISLPILPDKLDFIPRIILRKRIIMGLMDMKMNLSAFTLQEDISHFIYFPLNRVTNQREVIQLQTSIDWNHLVELDLSHNRLTTISGLDLINVTPRLKHLNLSHNCLEKITVLLNDRLLPLKTIHLEGNPLCHDYIDPEHYVKVIRMMFPAVVEIDGIPIHRKGELPAFKQNYCPDEALEVADKFLEIFFPLLDSGPDHRSLMQGMYEDDAILSVTYSYKLHYGQIYRNFRNLFLYARFLDEGETKVVVGAMSITKLINRWPHTEHDPFTFTVDVLYRTETITILRVNGVLKLTAKTLTEDEHLLSFTRTVVLHSEDGAEYKIHNEMVYWSEPTAAAARSAFRVNTISRKNFNLKIEATTDDLREKFLKIFMKLTSMDKKISERCLEINNWNLKLALERFTKLLKLNNLDSLTQKVEAIS